jgi:uncharacterized membrane protein/protein-disulfide isomerase
MNRVAWPWCRWLLLGLNLLALALSGYLAWHSLTGGAMIGCSGGSSCDEVLNSRWSSIGGVLPVSGLAIGAYLAMLVASFCLGPGTEASIRRLAWRAMLVLAGAVAGSAVWFIVVQAAIVRAFCPYCMTAHVTGLLLATLVVSQALRQWAKERSEAEGMRGREGSEDPATNLKTSENVAAAVRPLASENVGAAMSSSRAVTPSGAGLRPAGRVEGPPHWRPAAVAGSVLIGLLAAGLLAASQAVFAPKTVYSRGDSPEADAGRGLDPHQIPLLGSPEAPYVVTLSFDYNCSHCQQLHFLLEEVVRRYAGKVAFALCPAPLNTQCNPYIPQTVPAFASSCDLARIALAVWAAKREAFPAFDQWMFSLESGDRWRPRTVEAARAKAIELVGRSKFEAALANPWIDQYLQASVQIFGNAGAGAVPKFVFGPHWVTPEADSADDLMEVLQDALLLPKF